MVVNIWGFKIGTEQKGILCNLAGSYFADSRGGRSCYLGQCNRDKIGHSGG